MLEERKDKVIILILMLILLVGVGLVYAQIDFNNPDSFDYSSDEFYKDPCNDWDLDLIDWEKIDFSRENLNCFNNIFKLPEGILNGYLDFLQKEQISVQIDNDVKIYELGFGEKLGKIKFRHLRNAAIVNDWFTFDRKNDEGSYIIKNMGEYNHIIFKAKKDITLYVDENFPEHMEIDASEGVFIQDGDEAFKVTGKIYRLKEESYIVKGGEKAIFDGIYGANRVEVDLTLSEEGMGVLIGDLYEGYLSPTSEFIYIGKDKIQINNLLEASNSLKVNILNSQGDEFSLEPLGGSYLTLYGWRTKEASIDLRGEGTIGINGQRFSTTQDNLYLKENVNDLLKRETKETKETKKGLLTHLKSIYKKTKGLLHTEKQIHLPFDSEIKTHEDAKQWYNYYMRKAKGNLKKAEELAKENGHSLDQLKYFTNQKEQGLVTKKTPSPIQINAPSEKIFDASFIPGKYKKEILEIGDLLIGAKKGVRFETPLSDYYGRIESPDVRVSYKNVNGDPVTIFGEAGTFFKDFTSSHISGQGETLLGLDYQDLDLKGIEAVTASS
ncbi:MAG: hypothetical protein ACTSRA_21775, partial [Promethearchaeota archaeon]